MVAGGLFLSFSGVFQQSKMQNTQLENA